MAKKTPKKTPAAKTATKKASTKKAADQAVSSEEMLTENTAEAETSSEPEETSILLRKFSSSWTPETTYKIEQIKSSEDFKAPPFTEDENVKKLLFLKFDISTFPKELTPENKKKQDETVQKMIEDKEKRKAEFAAMMKAAQEQARLKAEEEARKKAEEEARLAAEAKAVENARTEARKRLEEYEKAVPPKVYKSFKKESEISLGIIVAGIIFILMVSIVVFKSAINSSKYYVKKYSNGIEIWKGNFSPKGSDIIADLNGVKAPETIQDCYSKNEIAPIIFNYYLNTAEKQLKINEPKLAKASAEKAIEFAVDSRSINAANKCIAMVDFMDLLEKADIEMAKGDYKGIQNSINLMAKTPKFNLEDSHVVIIENKINAAKAQLAELKKISGSKLMPSDIKKISSAEESVTKTDKALSDAKSDTKSAH